MGLAELAVGTAIAQSHPTGVGALAVLMVFLIPLAAIIGFFMVLALKILRGNPRRRTGSESEEETRMIQEIYSGLARLDERVEALETLVLDRERKDESP